MKETNQINPENLYSTTEAAPLLGVHPRTVRRYVLKDKFPNSVKLGDRYYIPGQDILDYLETQETQ